MNIAGMGIVFNRGRGLQSLEKALEDGWMPPCDSMYSIPEDALKDKSLFREMRRADSFSKMACLAAQDAFTDSGLSDGEKGSLGIILATAFGPYVTTFRFLDDILHYGDAKVSPTVFSHSVHNAAVSYVASCLQSRGPTLTVTQFNHSFHQAVMLAESWLAEGRCDHVLVGGADQCDDIMKYICTQKIRLAEDGRIKPFLFAETPEAVPGEGSVFFLVNNGATPGKYGSISTRIDESPGTADMCVLVAAGMTGSEKAYAAAAEAGPPISSYAPIFGSMLTASGFSCAAAALMLRNQCCYAAPVQDNPHGVRLCEKQRSASIKTIRCIEFGCKREKMEFLLKQAHD